MSRYDQMMSMAKNLGYVEAEHATTTRNRGDLVPFNHITSPITIEDQTALINKGYLPGQPRL